jgi:hypothetical protein
MELMFQGRLSFKQWRWITPELFSVEGGSEVDY